MAKRTITVPVKFSLEECMKENSEIKKEDLRVLREWCEKQPHLPNIPDVYMIMFLNSNYFRIEPTKNTIENYFTLRSHIPEFFCNRDLLGDRNLRRSNHVQITFVLPDKTPEGYNIIYARLLDSEPAHYNFNDSVKLCHMNVDLELLKDPTAKGWVFVGDCTGAVFGHLARLTPMSIMKHLRYVQEGIPMRLKAVHWIHAPPVMEMALNMSKPFMQKEFLSLIHIHSSMDTFKPYMPIEILPKDSGGSGRPSSEYISEQSKKLEDHRDWFCQEEAIFRVDESRRIGKSQTANDLFGVDGSFKKLEID